MPQCAKVFERKNKELSKFKYNIKSGGKLKATKVCFAIQSNMFISVVELETAVQKWIFVLQWLKAKSK